MTSTCLKERSWRRAAARVLIAMNAAILCMGIMALPVQGQAQVDECLYFPTAFSDLVAVNTTTLAVDDILPRPGVVDPAVQCTRSCSYEIAARQTGMTDLMIVGARAYVARGGGARLAPGTLEVVNLRDGTIERTTPIGVGPHDMQLANGKIYVAIAADDRVDVIDFETFETSSIGGFEFPTRLAVTPDESALFVGSQVGRVDRVDTKTGRIIGTRSIPGDGGVYALRADENQLLVGSGGQVQGYDLDLNHRFTISVGHLVSDIATLGNQLFVSTYLSLGQFPVGTLDPPAITGEIDLEPLLRIESWWGDVRVAANGRVFLTGPGQLYVIDPVRLKVARRMRFNAAGCTAYEGGGCSTGGGPDLLAVTLAPCQEATPTPTPTATPTATSPPTPTPTPPPTATATATPTHTAMAVPTSSPTRTAVPSSGDGCALPGGTTPSPASAWLLLGAPALVWLTRRRRSAADYVAGGGSASQPVTCHAASAVPRRKGDAPMRYIALPMIVLAAVLLGAPAPAAAQTCTGDLDGDGDVEVTEVVYLARCALRTAVVQCPPEEVTVDTVIAAVNNALLGCGDRVWMVTVPCRQCEPCRFGDDWVLLRGLPGFDAALVAALLPEGIVPLGQRIVWPEAVCYACGCPGGPIVYVRASRQDVPALRAAGWWPDA